MLVELVLEPAKTGSDSLLCVIVTNKLILEQVMYSKISGTWHKSGYITGSIPSEGYKHGSMLFEPVLEPTKTGSDSLLCVLLCDGFSV